MRKRLYMVLLGPNETFDFFVVLHHIHKIFTYKEMSSAVGKLKMRSDTINKFTLFSSHFENFKFTILFPHPQLPLHTKSY